MDPATTTAKAAGRIRVIKFLLAWYLRCRRPSSGAKLKTGCESDWSFEPSADVLRLAADAARGLGQEVETFRLDRLPTVLADAIGAGARPLERVLEVGAMAVHEDGDLLDHLDLRQLLRDVEGVGGGAPELHTVIVEVGLDTDGEPVELAPRLEEAGWLRVH